MSARDEEAGQHHQTGEQSDPEREHIESREGHVPRPDHERDEKITEAAYHDRHHHKEDHEGGMYGEEHIISLRRNDPFVGVGFRQPPQPWHRRLGPGKLPADHHRHKPAQNQHEKT